MLFVKRIITSSRKFTTNQALRTSLRSSPNAHLDKNVYDRYMSLPQPDCRSQVEYIWIDGTGKSVSSRCRLVSFNPTNSKQLPKYHFDGSYTFHPDPRNTDINTIPVALYDDPIRRCDNKLVLCETYTSEMKPTKTNFRQKALETLTCAAKAEPMFAVRQDFYLTAPNHRPYGWPDNGEPPCIYSNTYCGIGNTRAYGREIVECIFKSALYSGIELHGFSAGPTLSQWRIFTGPTSGLKAADDLWMLRYLIQRISEDFGVGATFHPKLLPNWSPCGCHFFMSTNKMREDNGLKCVEEALQLLECKHREHMLCYDPDNGKYNRRRLIDDDQTSHFDRYTSGVGCRKYSVRIPKCVVDARKGFFEDRRPAGNCDPYRVINMLLQTVINQK